MTHATRGRFLFVRHVAGDTPNPVVRLFVETMTYERQGETNTRTTGLRRAAPTRIATPTPTLSCGGVVVTPCRTRPPVACSPTTPSQRVRDGVVGEQWGGRKGGVNYWLRGCGGRGGKGCGEEYRLEEECWEEDGERRKREEVEKEEKKKREKKKEKRKEKREEKRRTKTGSQDQSKSKRRCSGELGAAGSGALSGLVGGGLRCGSRQCWLERMAGAVAVKEWSSCRT